MTKTIKNNPDLRFNEFKEDWFTINLLSITDPKGKYGIVDGPFGSNLKTIHYMSEGIPIITSGYVTDGVFKADEYLYVTQEKFNKEKRSAVNGGDIVMAKIGARCGSSAILPKNHETGILSGNALKITVDESRFSINFIWQQLWRLYQIHKIDLLKTVGAQPAISIANLKKFKLITPSLPEQQKIADFLSAVDKKIELLTCKKELLEKYKKGVMQKIFSQEIRFKQDDGSDYPDWEEKRLGEVFNINAGGDIEKENVSKIKTNKFRYPIYSNSEKDKGLYGFSNLFKVDTECITVSGRGSLGIANARTEKFYPIVRLLILIPELPSNIKFYENYINRMNFFVESTGVPQLTSPQIANYKVSYPYIDEQVQIANFLNILDQKIYSVNNQIIQTQQFKKGLLQQMFV